MIEWERWINVALDDLGQAHRQGRVDGQEYRRRRRRLLLTALHFQNSSNTVRRAIRDRPGPAPQPVPWRIESTLAYRRRAWTGPLLLFAGGLLCATWLCWKVWK
ncbi:hypothetical protein [Pseudoxanthomonas putridarboris]|uniref:Uncharacterized protein n=1 Tax=Pseudoxanthomonas putridarboris TaxID=752605 RepID=A0ABU9J5R5_9GAMM